MHAARAQASADRATEQRRHFVTHQTIEHAARLLCVDQVLVDLFRMLESFLHRALGDLIEHHAKGRYGGFLRDDLLREVLADGFAFSIRVGGQVNSVNFFGGLL